MFQSTIYNDFHNILRLFEEFLFTTSEMMRDYYLYAWYVRVAEQIAKQPKT